METGYVALAGGADDDLDVFFGPHAQVINRARLDWLGGAGIPLQGARVLDVGCGPGLISAALVDEGARVVGVDGRIGVVEAARSSVPGAAFAVRDIQRESLLDLGRFGVVVALGLLYHLRHPLLALEYLAQVCDGDLVLETQVCDSTAAVLRQVAEPSSANQALDGIGCRPSVAWLQMALRTVGFGEVRIAPSGAVNHEDFRWDPIGDDAIDRDGHPLRVMVHATRTPDRLGRRAYPYEVALGEPSVLSQAYRTGRVSPCVYRVGTPHTERPEGEVVIELEAESESALSEALDRLGLVDPRGLLVNVSSGLAPALLEAYPTASRVELSVPLPSGASDGERLLADLRERGYRVCDVRVHGGAGLVVLQYGPAVTPVVEWVEVPLDPFVVAGDGTVESSLERVVVTTSSHPWGYGAIMPFGATTAPQGVRFVLRVSGAPAQIAILRDVSEIVSAVTLSPRVDPQAVALAVPPGDQHLGVVFRTAAEPGPSVVEVESCHMRF